MKVFGKFLTFVLLICFLAGCASPAPAATQPAATQVPAKPADTAAPKATDVPPTAVPAPTLTAKDEWTKANQLGDFYAETQDWTAIEAAAKKEGKVIVYANSSKISKAAELWATKYPEIAMEGYDLGGDDVLAKTLGEQQAGLFVGDVWFSSGGADVVGNVLPNKYIWRFVPDTMAGKVDPKYTQPLLFSRFGQLCWLTTKN